MIFPYLLMLSINLTLEMRIQQIEILERTALTYLE